STPATPTAPGFLSLAAAVLAGLLAACGGATSLVGGDAITSIPAPPPSPSPASDPTVRDADGIQATLDGVAAAMHAGDVAALRRLPADPTSPFGTRWQQRAERMADLPLTTYELELDRSVPDLVTDPVRQRHAEAVQLVAVLERHALEGFDESGPAEEVLFLTLV